MTKMLMVVDTQRDFLDPEGVLYVKGDRRYQLWHWERRVDQYLDAALPVVFTMDTHIRAIYEQSEEALQFLLHCEKYTWGWHNPILDNLYTLQGATVLEKSVFDVWMEPANRIRLIALINDFGITEVEIIGVASDYCVKMAAVGFLREGVNVFVNRKLVSEISQNIDEVAAELNNLYPGMMRVEDEETNIGGAA